MIVPACLLGGILLFRKRPVGYLITGIILLKGATMLVCLGAMMVGEFLAGTARFSAEIILFPILILSGITMTVIYLRNVGGKA